MVEDTVQTRLSENFPGGAVRMGSKMQVHLPELTVGTLMTNIGHVTVLSQPVPTAAR